MTTKALREFRDGLAEIERKLSESIQSKSTPKVVPEFAWSPVPDAHNIPDFVDADVKWQGREVTLRFSRQQIEDSWGGVSDPYAKAVIQEGINRLTR